MIETTGNLWNFPTAEVVVITTNGSVKKNGECVMGRGCAKEARDMFPGIARELGHSIHTYGNHVCSPGSTMRGQLIYAMPVKHSWEQPADLDLILRSASELVVLANSDEVSRIIMPRPGCGNGQLSWTDVGPLLHDNLDDRFAVTTF